MKGVCGEGEEGEATVRKVAMGHVRYVFSELAEQGDKAPPVPSSSVFSTLELRSNHVRSVRKNKPSRRKTNTESDLGSTIRSAFLKQMRSWSVPFLTAP